MRIRTALGVALGSLAAMATAGCAGRCSSPTASIPVITAVTATTLAARRRLRAIARYGPKPTTVTGLAVLAAITLTGRRAVPAAIETDTAQQPDEPRLLSRGLR